MHYITTVLGLLIRVDLRKGSIYFVLELNILVAFCITAHSQFLPFSVLTVIDLIYTVLMLMASVSLYHGTLFPPLQHKHDSNLLAAFSCSGFKLHQSFHKSVGYTICTLPFLPQ